jgi:hypothetical protein
MGTTLRNAGAAPASLFFTPGSEMAFSMGWAVASLIPVIPSRLQAAMAVNARNAGNRLKSLFVILISHTSILAAAAKSLRLYHKMIVV